MDYCIGTELLNSKNKPKNKIEFLKKFARLNYKKLYKINLQTPKISEQSAMVAKILGVRNILKKYQRDFIKKYRLCDRVEIRRLKYCQILM